MFLPETETQHLTSVPCGGGGVLMVMVWEDTHVCVSVKLFFFSIDSRGQPENGRRRRTGKSWVDFARHNILLLWVGERKKEPRIEISLAFPPDGRDFFPEGFEIMMMVFGWLNMLNTCSTKGFVFVLFMLANFHPWGHLVGPGSVSWKSKHAWIFGHPAGGVTPTFKFVQIRAINMSQPARDYILTFSHSES